MGKVGSKLTQALGFGGAKTDDNQDTTEVPVDPRPPQWDTAIDQLFGDAPPDDSVIDSPQTLDIPIEPKRRQRRRRPPPPPPSILNSDRRRPLPTGRRRNRRGAAHAMRTPIIPDIPRRPAKCGIHAINAPFGVNRRPMVIPAAVTQHEGLARVPIGTNFKRQPSARRRRQPSSQRNQRLQELLQCPVCLTPYTEPRLLPCGHTYCHACLNRLIQNDADVVTCPECRKQHLVPDDGVFPPNFVVRNLLDEQGSIDQDRFSMRSKRSSGKVIQFYVAVRKITRSHSQVKRLTIDMPMGNYLQDTCQTLIHRIADREQLQPMTHQLVLEFGDKRLRHQRTLASYGVQNGDLLFLFNPDQRLSFLAYDDEDNPSLPPPLIPRDTSRVRTTSFNSSASDIRTATSADMNYNRVQHPLSTLSDHNDYTAASSSLYSDG